MKQVKTFRTFSFYVPGDPIPMPHPVTCENKMWNDTKARQVQYKISLLNQFEDQLSCNSEPEPIEGAVELALHFFLAPKPLCNLKELNRKPHFDPPRLVELERFVQHMMAHLIYTRSCRITKVTAQKTFDSTPRTVIKMKVLDE